VLFLARVFVVYRRQLSSSVIAHEGLTGVQGDVERVVFTRQVSPLSSHAVPVPQLEADERRRVRLEAYLVDEHVRRRHDPRQVSDAHLADPTYPLAVALLIRVERPALGANERLLRVGVACRQIQVPTVSIVRGRIATAP